MQSFFIGTGAVFASCLPWILSNLSASPRPRPRASRPTACAGPSTSARPACCRRCCGRCSRPRNTARTRSRPSTPHVPCPASSPTVEQAPARSSRAYILGGLIWAAIGALGLIGVAVCGSGEGALRPVPAASPASACCRSWSAPCTPPEPPTALTEIVDDIFRMPETMRGLAVVQFFSWFALFAMWIYTTAAVTAVHYGTTDTTSVAYNAGRGLGRRAVRRLQRRRGAGGLRHPGPGPEDRPPRRPCDQSGARRAGPDRRLR